MLLAIQRTAGNAVAARWLSAQQPQIQRVVEKKAYVTGAKKGSPYWISSRNRRKRFASRAAAEVFDRSMDSGARTTTTTTTATAASYAPSTALSSGKTIFEEEQKEQLSDLEEGEEERLALDSSSSSSMDETEDSEPTRIVSGHGSMELAHLPFLGPTSSRGRGTGPRKTTFTVPDGMTITFYAPRGAALDNAVANRIERGDIPRRDELEMKFSDGSKVVPLPDDFGYPDVYTSGADAPNYTVGPPRGLKLEGKPATVKTPTLLETLMTQLKQEGFKHVQYACCSVERGEFRQEWSGWHVRLKF